MPVPGCWSPGVPVEMEALGGLKRWRPGPRGAQRLQTGCPGAGKAGKGMMSSRIPCIPPTPRRSYTRFIRGNSWKKTPVFT